MGGDVWEYETDEHSGANKDADEEEVDENAPSENNCWVLPRVEASGWRRQGQGQGGYPGQGQGRQGQGQGQVKGTATGHVHVQVSPGFAISERCVPRQTSCWSHVVSHPMS